MAGATLHELIDYGPDALRNIKAYLIAIVLLANRSVLAGYTFLHKVLDNNEANL